MKPDFKLQNNNYEFPTCTHNSNGYFVPIKLFLMMSFKICDIDIQSIAKSIYKYENAKTPPLKHKFITFKCVFINFAVPN